MPRATRRFLTAEWRDLAMLNFAIDPAILAPLVPRGTELDSWHATTYVSLVGFRFLRTRLLGLPVPWHRDFEEVNLRFYVRRREGSEIRRGVVFIRELVPRRAIAAVARVWYNEPYTALPMRHRITRASHPGGGARTSTSSSTSGHDADDRGAAANARTNASANADADMDSNVDAPVSVEYQWQRAGVWEGFSLRASGEAAPVDAGSEAEYITEHYWGYTAQRDGGAVEYEVRHPRWRVWPAVDVRVTCDVAALYGPAFVPALSEPPRSAFVADGSAIAVHQPRRLPID